VQYFSLSLSLDEQTDRLPNWRDFLLENPQSSLTNLPDYSPVLANVKVERPRWHDLAE
jgi:hypothetical protein